MKVTQKGISENASYKIVALLITLILWVIILGSKEATLVKMISTNYILPRDMAVVNSVPTEIAFRLTGPRLPLKRFSETIEPLAVDLSSALEGSTTIRIHPDSIDVPPGVRVVSVSPASLLVKLERVVSRKVPVEVTLTGNLPTGLKVVSVKAVPPTVELLGTRSTFDRIRKIKTEAIDLSQTSSSIDENKVVVLEDPGLIKTDPKPQVRIIVEVK